MNCASLLQVGGDVPSKAAVGQIIKKKKRKDKTQCKVTVGDLKKESENSRNKMVIL